MLLSGGSRSCNSPRAGKAESAAPEGNGRAKVCRSLACWGWGAPAPGGPRTGEHLACEGRGASPGLQALTVTKRFPSAPCRPRQRPARRHSGSICHRERTNPFFFLDYLQCTDHGSKRRWNRCLLILPELMNTLPRVPSGDCRTLGFKAKVV
ncbi:uncharacterized protein [Oryctolagus cuniculus]|uniref:uncharacterized protein isoform X2 n=1 Tax=Oryctolagus cuniculus TaxID=9986 RepID=UPI00387A60E4